MNPLFAAALELQRFFEARAWRFCFIGGFAVQRWGEPRLTLDVHCTLLTGFGQEERYVDELLAAFAGRVDHPRDFALAHRVLLLRGPSRVPLDIALGAMPFEERCVERASAFDISDTQSLTMCSAEDLVVFKAFAGRERDWLDIEGIVLRQVEALDADTIWRELIPLLELKGDRAAEPRLRATADEGQTRHLNLCVLSVLCGRSTSTHAQRSHLCTTCRTARDKRRCSARRTGID